MPFQQLPAIPVLYQRNDVLLRLVHVVRDLEGSRRPTGAGTHQSCCLCAGPLHELDDETGCDDAACNIQHATPTDLQAVKTQQISLDSFSAMATLANWVETVRETWSKADTLMDEKPEEIDRHVMLANLSNLEIRQLKSGHHICTGTRLAVPHLHRDWAHPCPCLHRDWARPSHICTGNGLTPPASAPGLGSPCHLCIRTGLTPATSGPGLGSLPATFAHLRPAGLVLQALVMRNG